MPITFYPNEEDLDASSLSQKLETMIEAAENFKAAILDAGGIKTAVEGEAKKRGTPRELLNSYNWSCIAKLLREIRELPEATPAGKLMKAENLTKLAEVYEVLRGAKMPKLEAVRIALMNEANHLRSSSQVA